MWINNYDDPDEMTIEEALSLLAMNQYRLVLVSGTFKVFQHPFALDRLYFCLDNDDVIDLTIGEGLLFIDYKEQRVRKCFADLCLARSDFSCYYS